MSQFKIIFSGPVGAGKTSAINCISDIPTISTEARASDETALVKQKTTVAMDYGVVKLDTHHKVHLYGTPGQQRFDFMWEILSEGALGLVLVIDNSVGDPLADLSFYLQSFRQLIDKTALVIGLSRCDIHATYQLQDYHQLLEKENIQAAVFEVDARDKKDIRTLVQALLLSLDAGL